MKIKGNTLDIKERDLSIADDLTAAELREVNQNIAAWKAEDSGRLLSLNLSVCETGFNWVKTDGKFPEGTNTGKLKLAEALKIDATSSIANAFIRKHIVGILAAESRFGHVFTKFKPTDLNFAVGGFQILPAKALAEFNKNNSPFAGDQIDDNGAEFINASKVAAWYLARGLQYCTIRTVDGADVGSIRNVDEAGYFAIAIYNKGVGTITNARRACKAGGKDNTVWENVKTFLDATNRDVKKYVARVVLYGDGLK